MQEQQNNEQSGVTVQTYEDLRKMTELKHRASAQLVKAHLINYGATMIATNGVSYQTKLNALTDMVDAVLFAIDYGLDITKPELKQKGAAAKQQQSLAAILAQALDNRFLLIADNMRKEDEKQEQTVENEQATETQGETNV